MVAMDRRQFMRALGAGLGATAAVAVVGCAAKDPIDYVPSDSGATPAVRVSVIDNKFVPASVTVKPGEAVEWVFEGAMKHDVVNEAGEFASELLPNGSSYIHVFDKAGDYPYFCSIHPEMTGTVQVQ